MENSEKIGNYKLLEQIGEGGMATIYRASHEVLKRDVALKKMKKPSRESISRFKHEAQMSAKLNHENIVSVYDFIQEGRSFYLVLEYIDGIDVRNVLEIDSPIPHMQAVRIVHEVAMGLEYAHFKKIIHRDIKPSNILLSKDGDIKIIDFGVAKAESTSQMTTTGIIVGTPSYMSPEYANGEELTPQSDVYSLGVLIFELLTGFKPFVAPTNNELLIAITKGKYRKPRKYNREIPFRLQRIVSKAMHVNPRKRYKSMADFIRALSRYLKNEPQSNIKRELQLYFGEVSEKNRQKKYQTSFLTGDSDLQLGLSRKKWKKVLISTFAVLVLVFGSYFSYKFLKNSVYSELQIELNIEVPAKIYLDDKLLGESENKRFYDNFISSGKRKLIIDAGPNYGKYERWTIFKSGHENYISAPIEKRRSRAYFSIDSTPQGAVVHADNANIGKTPLEDRRLKAGEHEISVKAPGYKSFRIKRDFTSAEDITIFVELEKE